MSAKSEISRTDVFFYSLPMVAGGAMMFLLGSYLMPYATNILLIAPGVMGTLFFISRIWDAVNDPIFGHLCDRTRHSFGRRRIWIAASALPIALFFIMLWVPWSESIRVVMLGGSLILFYTALTGLYVPHYSLGAEISQDPYDRHRVYGGRAVAENIGTFLGVALMSLFLQNDPALTGGRNPSDMKEPLVMSIFTVVAILLIALMVFKVRERRELPQAVPFLTALSGIWKNHHARVILAAGFFSQTGAMVVMTSVVYYSAYILGNSELSVGILAIFLGVATFSIPVWVRVINPHKKRIAWMMANIGLALSFGGCYFFEGGDVSWVMMLAATAGFSAGVIFVVNPAALADTIDYHEFHSGTRSEGAYFSVFTFVNKSAMGFAAVLVGFFLELGSFMPNIEQTTKALDTIRLIFTFIPFLCFILGVFVLLFYSLDIATIRKTIQEKG